ncbi:hypothetical protein SD208_19755 [Ochrobactrum sp. BD67]
MANDGETFLGIDLPKLKNRIAAECRRRSSLQGLRRIAEFYAVEADIRGISPGQRLSARQTRTAPLVVTFGE